MLILGATLLVAILVGLLAFLLLQDVFTSGNFPPGVSVVGVNVSGLSRTEAVDKVTSELSEVANRPLALKVDDEAYQITPQEIGLRLEYGKMVEQAYDQAWSVNVFERMARRFVNRPKRINVWLMAVKNEQAIRDFVTRAVASINRPPRNAYVDVTSGVPVVVPARDGRQTDFNQLLEATGEAIGTPNRTVNVRVQRTPAAIPDSTIGKLIVINVAAHSLSLYNREQLLAQFPVACGSPTWPTPAGHWKIVSKQRNPSWTNPGSSWAASMPPFIGPGPGNPLGTRAMALSASGVLIHGTPSSWSIGSNVSHGCIRMYMKDVEALFDMVEANTPVYVIKSAGNPGFDVTRS
jgi:lipoprotein-anchoring transpeptidase ErfK/SrfK